jgi:hypothetical protein
MATRGMDEEECLAAAAGDEFLLFQRLEVRRQVATAVQAKPEAVIREEGGREAASSTTPMASSISYRLGKDHVFKKRWSTRRSPPRVRGHRHMRATSCRCSGPCASA